MKRAEIVKFIGIGLKYLTYCLLIGITSAAFWGINQQAYAVLSEYASRIISDGGVAIAGLAGAAVAIFSAIKSSVASSDRKSKIDAEDLGLLTDDEWAKKLASLNKKMKDQYLNNDSISEEDIESLTDEAVSEIKSRVSEELIRDYAKKDRSYYLFKKFKVLRYSNMRHLSSYSNQLSSRSTVNLAVGVTFGSIGILMILGFLFFAEKKDFSGVNPWLDFCAYYVPRIGVAIFIELLAFFFLRQYGKILDDLKFVHNEITTADMKYSAVLVSLLSSNDEALTSVVKKLSEADRNLRIGTTDTLEAKLEKIDLSDLAKALKPLGDLVGKAEPKK